MSEVNPEPKVDPTKEEIPKVDPSKGIVHDPESSDEEYESDDGSSDEEYGQTKLVSKFYNRNLYDAGGDGDCGPKSMSLALMVEGDAKGIDYSNHTHVLIRKAVDKERSKKTVPKSWWTDDHWDAAAKLYKVKIHIINMTEENERHNVQTFPAEPPLGFKSSFDIFIAQVNNNHFVCALDPKSGANYVRKLPCLGAVKDFFGKSNSNNNSKPAVDFRNGRKDIGDFYERMVKNPDVNRMLEIINKVQDPTTEELQECSAVINSLMMTLSFPAVCAILIFGSQSSGKSTLCSGLLSLPVTYAANGTATRAPVKYVRHHGKENRVTVNGKDVPILSVGVELQKLMLQIEKTSGMQNEPIEVVFTSTQPGGIFIYDNPGLITNTSEVNAKKRETVKQMCTDMFREYVAKQDSGSIAVMVTRTNDATDPEKICWDEIIASSGESIQNLAKNGRLVIALTYGDRDIAEKTQQNVFRDCKNWRDVKRTLFAPLWNLLGSRDVPIFITAMDGSMDTVKIQDIVKKEGPSKALEMYEKANNSANSKLARALKVISENDDFNDSQEEFDEFMKKHVGVNQFVKYLREQQLKAFIRNLPRISQILMDYSSDCGKKLREAQVYQKELQETPITHLIENFFGIFILLLNCIMIGERILPDTMSSKKAFVQQEDDTLKKETVFTGERPAPVNWIVREKWIAAMLAGGMTMEDEINFAKNGVPAIEVMDSFPFSDDSEENQKMEERFVERYCKSSHPQGVAVSRMRNLTREIIARAIWIDPGSISEMDFVLDSPSKNSTSATFEGCVASKLDRVTEMRFKKGVTNYAARRFSAIVWHCIQIVLNYMKTIQQFQPLLQIEEFCDDLTDLLTEVYYKVWNDKIKKYMEDVASTINCFIDPFSPMFYELSPLLMTFDSNYASKWIQSHPSNDNYAKIMASVIAEYVEDVLPIPTPVAKGVKKGNLALAIENMFSSNSSSSENPTKHFFRTIWPLERFSDPAECSDAIMFLMDIGNCPDTLEPRSSRHSVSKHDLEQANTVFKRMFRSRVLDFQRTAYSQMTKNIELSSDHTKLSWAAPDLHKKFKEKLVERQNKLNIQYQEDGQNELVVDASNWEALLKHQYKLTDTAADLRKQIEELKQADAIFQSISKAVNSFGRIASKESVKLLDMFSMKKAGLNDGTSIKTSYSTDSFEDIE